MDGSAGTITVSGVYTAPIAFPANSQSIFVTVHAADLSGTSQATATFTLAYPAAPKLTGAQPTSLVPGQQTTISLTGTDLGDVNVVSVNGTLLAPLSTSSTQLTVSYSAPAWASGTVAIVASTSTPITASSNSISVTISSPEISYDAASRFLSQATWGPTSTTIQQVQQMGFSAFIDHQLSAVPDNFIEDADPGHDAMSLLDQARGSDANQLRTKMAWIWWKMFSTPGSVVAWLTTSVPQTVDRDAFGSFEALLTDVTLNPVMGNTLNYNVADPAGNPNLNYGRESMQLFSIGPVLLNPDGSSQLNANNMEIAAYSPADISAIARAVTGFNNPPSWNNGGDYYGKDQLVSAPADWWQHDEGSKTVLGIGIPAGQTATQDTVAVTRILAAHPNTAPFISKYLIHELVTSNPSPAYVGRISAVWSDDGNGNRGNLAAVIKAILLDPEARAGDFASGLTADEGRFRDLVEYASYINRALGNNGGHTSSVEFSFASNEECVWTSPSIFGFYQQQTTLPNSSVLAPEFQLFNEPTIQARAAFLNSMIYMPAGGDQNLNNIDWSYWGQLTSGDGAAYIDFANHMIFHGTMSDDLTSVLRSDAQQYSDPQARAQQMMMDTFLSPEAQVQR